MSLRRLALTGAVLLLAAAAPGVAAAATRGAAARSGSVLAPRGGQLVRADVVRIRVRAGNEPWQLIARLNGRQIGSEFGYARHGVRSLAASVSAGLRRGRNVLVVTVRGADARPHRSTVRFRVATNRPLVGAGIDERVVVGEKVRLDGVVVSAKGESAGVAARWRMVRRETKRSAVASARLSHSGRLHAGFRALAPGQYTLQLSAQRAGEARSATAAAASPTRSTSDAVTLTVVPPNPLVSVDTMVRPDDKPGIQVGGTPYLAPERQSKPAEFVQVLVLDRRTLAMVSNDSYVNTDDLEAALQKLTASKLVIAVLQKAGPGAGGGSLTGKASLAEALAPIGFRILADVSKTPLAGGDLSVIGVPRTSPGDADVHVSAQGGQMQGYLTPDQWRNYGFTSPTLIPFDFPPAPNSSTQSGSAGFVVADYDGRTGAVRDKQTFTTNGWPPIGNALDAVKAMTSFISAIPAGDPVGIGSFSDFNNGDGSRLELLRVGAVDRDTMTRLANAIAGLGGTRNGINQAMFLQGPSSGARAYALMGWAGAGEGNGAELSLGVDGATAQRSVPKLSGVVRRDSQYQLRPYDVSTDGVVSDKLQQLVVQTPGSEAWPLENNPAEMRALAYLGDQDTRLGSDPRAAYWTHEGDESEWNNIAAKIRDVSYPSNETQFTVTEFRIARSELVKELRWVGRVRGYLKLLSSPFSSGTALREWADIQRIADQVHLDSLPADTGVSVRWLQFTSTLLKALGPFTAGVTTLFSTSLDFGVWLAGANVDGTPGYDQVHVKADQLGSTVVDQALDTQATYDTMGDIIVSDYHKLRVLGESGGCNPSAAGCDKDFAFTKDDKAESVAAVYRAVERMTYEKFVPFAYRVYQLNTSPDGIPEPRRPPELGRYRCGTVIHFTPFTPDRGFSPLTTNALLQNLDSAHGLDNNWEMFVIGSAEKDGNYGKGPPAPLLERMFDPIPDSLNPDEGGLGISRTQLMTTAPHWGWETPGKPGEDDCDFKG